MAKTAAQKAFDTVQKFSDLPPEVQARIAKEAVEASDDLGYCSEVTNVLEHMGFDAGDKVVKATIEATFDINSLDDFNDGNWTFYLQAEHNNSGKVYEIHDAEVASVVDA